MWYSTVKWPTVGKPHTFGLKTSEPDAIGYIYNTARPGRYWNHSSSTTTIINKLLIQFRLGISRLEHWTWTIVSNNMNMTWYILLMSFRRNARTPVFVFSRRFLTHCNIDRDLYSQSYCKIRSRSVLTEFFHHIIMNTVYSIIVHDIFYVSRSTYVTSA